MAARAKRSLGQNFLVDGNIQRKIVEALEATSEDEVLEIGPGRGALTQHLAGQVRRLVLLELDDALAAELSERYSGRGEVEVVHADVLTEILTARLEAPGRALVLGNIPYNITTPILFKLLGRPRPARIVVMVQKEVAQRLLAPPGTSAYGALSVGVRTVATVEKVRDVPRTAFRPAPKVDSTVLRIVPVAPPPLREDEEVRLRRLTRTVFQWRRKQLRTILRDHPESPIPAGQLEAWANEGGWDLTRRPETFAPEEFVRMIRPGR